MAGDATLKDLGDEQDRVMKWRVKKIEEGWRYFGVLEGVGNSIAFSLRGANLRKSVPRSAVRSLARSARRRRVSSFS